MITNKLVETDLSEQFNQNGYLVVPDFIPAAICDLLISHATTLIEQFDLDSIKSLFTNDDNGYTNGQYFLDSGHSLHYFLDKNSFDSLGNFKVEKKYTINKLGHGLHEADPIFYCFSQMHAIVDLLDKLNVKNPTLLQSMYLCKQPFIGDEVGCHQDETYITLTNGHVLGLWFALEDATIHNGCLWVTPRAHNEKLKSRMIRSLDDEVHIEEYDKTPWPLENMIPLEVKKGSVVVLHGLLPHMSKHNKSSHSRHAYTLHVKAKNQKLAVGNWLSADGSENFIQL